MSEPAEVIIEGIMARYPEREWLQQSKQALPGESDGLIISIIEALSGGDVQRVPDA